MLCSTARYEVSFPGSVRGTGVAGFEFFQCLGHLRHHFNSLAFLISSGLPLFLLHKSEGKGSQKATAQVFHEAAWINRRNERALYLVHFRKQLKIKSHIFLVFNSQTWNDRFPPCLVCLLVHRPQCVEVMLQTDFSLKQMHITHSLLLYSGEMENWCLNWRNVLYFT